MKTLLLSSQDGTKTVEVKVDIFATNVELLTPGFDTRFTHMEIVEDEPAVVDGVALTEIENSWQAVIDFAVSKGYSLQVSDINENDTSAVVSISDALTGTVAGTKGASTLTGTATNFDPEVAVDDKILVDGFVYTVITITDDLSLVIDEELVADVNGASVFIVAKQ